MCSTIPCSAFDERTVLDRHQQRHVTARVDPVVVSTDRHLSIRIHQSSRDERVVDVLGPYLFLEHVERRLRPLVFEIRIVAYDL